MLTAADFIRAQLKRLHTGLDKALAELTPEQLHTVPAGHPKANTIGWGIWHYVRTEDNIVRWVIQDRRPPIWTESGYGQKLGLPPAAQGTGMSTEEAQALRIKDIPLFQEYTQKVWAGTEELFDARHARAPREDGDGQAARRDVGRPVPGAGRAHPRHDPPGGDRAGPDPDRPA